MYISGTGCLSNTGLPRNTLAYRKYQSCTTTVSPTFNSNTSAAGFSGAFCANTYTNPCSYYTQVPLTDNWITVNAFSHCGGSSTYNNQINYVVGANPNCTSRVGHIYLYDACNSTLQGTYTVTQSGSTSPVAPTSIYNETSGSPMCQQNTTVNLGANGINPATVGGQWVWYEGSCGGTQVGTGPDIYVSLSQAGTKTYYLRSESSCGNSVCLSTTVTVTAAPPAPTPTLQGSTPCEGSSFVLLAGVTGTYYEWTNPGGSVISNQQNPTITGGAAGQYCLNYDQNGCTSSNGCVNVSFSPLPSIANISGPSNPTEATSQTYNANASNATSYTWAVPSGWLITGGGTSSSINVTVGNSSGQVCATPHNTCDGPQGCKAVTVIPIGISENSVESNIKIYPNPANEFFNIKGDDIENDNYEISITNILGEQLNKAIINVDKHTIEYVLDIKEYASGIYYLNIKSKKINFTYKVEKL